MVIKAKECGIKKIYVPKANASEGAVVDGIEVYGIDNILQLKDYLNHILEPVPASLIHILPRKNGTTFRIFPR